MKHATNIAEKKLLGIDELSLVKLTETVKKLCMVSREGNSSNQLTLTSFSERLPISIYKFISLMVNSIFSNYFPLKFCTVGLIALGAIGCRTMGGLAPAAAIGGGSAASHILRKDKPALRTGADSIKFEYQKDRLKNCEAVGQSTDPGLSEVALREQASKIGANVVFMQDKIGPHEFYICGDLLKNRQHARQIELLRNTREFGMLMGHYISRHGILKDLGDLGPSIGLSLTSYANTGSDKKYRNVGWYLIWTVDHFFDTDSRLLKPEFFGNDFTNYMLGVGVSYRDQITPDWQYSLQLGASANFLEIDTFRRSAGSDKDEEFSGIATSWTIKGGVDYIIRRPDFTEIFDRSTIRIGPSLFYYFSPHLLKNFSSEEISDRSHGGSLALMIELKFEKY